MITPPLFEQWESSENKLSIVKNQYSSNQSISYSWNTSTNGSVTYENLATSSDGKFTVAASYGYWNQSSNSYYGGVLSLFYNSNQTPIWNFTGSQWTGVDISQDGSHIVGSNDDGMLYVWNNNSNIPIWTYSNSDRLFKPSISDDGSNIVVSDWVTEEIIFFENYSSNPKWRISSNDLGGGITKSLISPNGEYIVVYDDNYANLYSTNSTSPIWEFPDHGTGNQAWGVRFSGDSSTLVIGTYNGTSWTGSGDQTIYAGKTYLYDITNKIRIWEYTDNSRNLWASYDLSQNGEVIAKCDHSSENITIFNSTSEIPIWQYPIPGDDCWDIAISANGNVISAAVIDNSNSSGAVYWWNLNSSIPTKIHNFSNGQYAMGIEMSCTGAETFVGLQPNGVYLFSDNSITDLCPQSVHSEWNDTDGDGMLDDFDTFPSDPNEWSDLDGDGVGDNADVFPKDANETIDTDSDGVGDNADTFPSDPNEWSDLDGDGVGDNADIFPKDANETIDTDSDGVGDNADTFPSDPNEWSDLDGDGVGDNTDIFPKDANETIDTDSDGVGDNADTFPTTTRYQTGMDLTLDILLSTLFIVLMVITVMKIRNRRGGEDEYWYDDEMMEYQQQTSNISQQTRPLETRGYEPEETRYQPQESHGPDRNWNGQVADDGYEWLEHPEGSGSWFWKDPQTGEWESHQE